MGLDMPVVCGTGKKRLSGRYPPGRIPCGGADGKKVLEALSLTGPAAGTRKKKPPPDFRRRFWDRPRIKEERKEEKPIILPGKEIPPGPWVHRSG